MTSQFAAITTTRGELFEQTQITAARPVEEVVAAVQRHLRQEGETILGVYYHQTWGPLGEKVEVDCLIEMIDKIAIIGVESTLTEDNLKQFETKCRKVESMGRR